MFILEDMFGHTVSITNVYDLTTDVIKEKTDFNLDWIESISVMEFHDNVMVSISVEVSDIRVYNSECLITIKKRVSNIYCFNSIISVDITHNLNEIYMKKCELNIFNSLEVALFKIVDSNCNLLTSQIIYLLDLSNTKIDKLMSHVCEVDLYISTIRKGSINLAKEVAFIIGGSNIKPMRFILERDIFNYILPYLV